MALPEEYRDYFIRSLHDALSGHCSSSVREAVEYSERSKAKCIGITIETRPDYCLKRHLSDMLSYGCTRLEVAALQSTAPHCTAGAGGGAVGVRGCGARHKQGPHGEIQSYSYLPVTDKCLLSRCGQCRSVSLRVRTRGSRW